MGKQSSCIQMHVRAIVEQDGKIISKTRWKPSKSFVIAFLQHIASATQNAHKLGTDITGTGRTILTPSIGSYYFMRADAAIGVTAYGIVVGTGTTPPTNFDYKLEAQIAHGSDAGQLQYGNQSFTDPVEHDGVVDYILTRSFTNASGSTVTINEVGIYCATHCSGPALYYFCIARDLLTVEVPNGATVTIEYRLRTVA